MAKPPIRIRIIALALITLVTLSISTIVLELFLSDSFFLDLNVFLLPIGIGLLRGSSTARGCASVVCGFMGIALALALVVVLPILFFQPESIDSDIDSVPKAVLAITIALLLILAWRELCSEETVNWFESTRKEKQERRLYNKVNAHGKLPRRRFQFRISTLLFCTTLAALVCVSSREQILFHPREAPTISHTFPGGMAMITYGVRRHRWDETLGIVDFVVIETQSGARSFKSAVTTSYSSAYPGGRAIITKKDGEKIELPSDAQLYEISDGVLQTRTETVSLSQLELYLERDWEGPSIGELLAVATSADSSE